MKEAEVTNLEPVKTYIGKIIKLSKAGWGFISTDEMPFVRIYFYWTNLNNLGPTFPELHVGMKVECEISKYIDKKTNEDKGFRAYKIKVL